MHKIINYLRFEINNPKKLKELVLKRTCEPELFLLPYLVSEHDVSFDVGANIGEYTYWLEKIIPSSSIYAFEPNKLVYKMLKSSFPKVNHINMALSDKAGIRELTILIIGNSVYDTRSSLEQNIEPGMTGAHKQKVDVMTIDTFISEKKLTKIGFIKIDVEGHEFSLLKGAKHLLMRDMPVLLVEIEQRHHQFNINKIFKFILEFGYVGFFLNVETRKICSINNFDSHIHQNIEDIKTTKYINNFVFFDKKDSKLEPFKKIKLEFL